MKRYARNNVIMGGADNRDASFNCIGISGCDVQGIMHNAFHANNYIIQDIPIFGTFSGQLFIDLGTRALFITP